MDFNLEDEPRRATRTSRNHLEDEIGKIQDTTSTSRPFGLTASSRHLGKTMDSFNQLNFKTDHNKPLRCTSALSWPVPVTAGRSAARHRGHFKQAKPALN